MEKRGFIYVWMDKKHSRFYVGCHWGHEDDGYVCSSSWMLQAYKKRPRDFKRRIVERFDDRSKTNEIEHRWLQMIKPEELKGPRYYNFYNYRFGHWANDERSRMSVTQKVHTPERAAKVSMAMKGRKLSDEHKRKISETVKFQMTEERREHLRLLQTGKKMPPKSDEFRKRCSINSKRLQAEKRIGMHGRKHTQETLEKMSKYQSESNPMLGRKHSPEAIEKIRAASKGRRHSEEARAKISASKRAR